MKEKQIWGKIVSKCWTDEKFKEKLLKNPAAVFKENGLEVPAGTRVVMHQDTESVKNWVVPLKPCEELVEEELGLATAEVKPSDDAQCHMEVKP